MTLAQRSIHERTLVLAASAIDGQLSPAETAELEGHLAGCPACARSGVCLRSRRGSPCPAARSPAEPPRRPGHPRGHRPARRPAPGALCCWLPPRRSPCSASSAHSPSAAPSCARPRSRRSRSSRTRHRSPWTSPGPDTAPIVVGEDVGHDGLPGRLGWTARGHHVRRDEPRRCWSRELRGGLQRFRLVPWRGLDGGTEPELGQRTRATRTRDGDRNSRQAVPRRASSTSPRDQRVWSPSATTTIRRGLPARSHPARPGPVSGVRRTARHGSGSTSTSVPASSIGSPIRSRRSPLDQRATSWSDSHRIRASRVRTLWPGPPRGRLRTEPPGRARPTLPTWTWDRAWTPASHRAAVACAPSSSRRVGSSPSARCARARRPIHRPNRRHGPRATA